MDTKRAAALFLAALFIAGAVPASASGTIGAFAVRTQAPAGGQPIIFQVAVSAADTEGLGAKAYSVKVEIRDAQGALAGESALVNGEDAVAAGTSAVLLPTVSLPEGAAGTFSARAVLLRADGTKLDTSEPQTFVLGAVTLAPVATPAPGAATGFTLDGEVTNNNDVSNRVSQSAQLNLHGTFDPADSFTGSGGVSNNSGGAKPLLTFQLHQAQIQAGTFAPSFDPLVLDGATGAGLLYKNSPSAVRGLQFVALTGARGTLNPFSLGALSFMLPIVNDKSTLTFTAGAVRVDGGVPALDPIPVLDSGTFYGLAFSHADPKTTFTYGFHYGIIAYKAKNTGRSLTENAFTATTGFTTGKAAWTLDFARASPFYPTLTASGATPDRESERIGVRIPFGAISATIGLNGYDDDLPGAALASRTHFWTETLGLATNLRNGDSLSLNLAGSTQHQAGDLTVSPTATDSANATDSTNFSYNTKRGPYTLGYTLGFSNQRDDKNNPQHSTQHGLSVARTIGTGFTASSNLSVTTNVSNDNSSTALGGSLSLGYTNGPVTLSSALQTGRSRASAGTRPPDSSSLNFGVSLRPYKNFALQGNFTQSTSSATTQSGSLNVSQKF